MNFSLGYTLGRRMALGPSTIYAFTTGGYAITIDGYVITIR
jgi:hypothetical protein